MLPAEVEKLLTESHFKIGKDAESLQLDKQANAVLGMSFVPVENPDLFKFMLYDHLRICNRQGVIPKLLLPDALAQKWGRHTWKMESQEEKEYYERLYSQWADIYGITPEQLKDSLKKPSPTDEVFCFHSNPELQFQVVSWNTFLTAEITALMEFISTQFEKEFSKLLEHLIQTDHQLATLLSTLVQQISPEDRQMPKDLNYLQINELAVLFRIIFVKTFEGMTPLIAQHHGVNLKTQGYFDAPNNFANIKKGILALRDAVSNDKIFKEIVKKSFCYLLEESLVLPNILLPSLSQKQHFKSILIYLTLLKSHKSGPMEQVAKILKGHLQSPQQALYLTSSSVVYDLDKAEIASLSQGLIPRLSQNQTTRKRNSSSLSMREGASSPNTSRSSTPGSSQDDDDTQPTHEPCSGVPVPQKLKEQDSSSEGSGSPPASFEAKLPHPLPTIPFAEANRQTPNALKPFNLDSTIVNTSSSEGAEKNPATSKAILVAQLSLVFMTSMIKKLGTKDSATLTTALDFFVGEATNIIYSAPSPSSTGETVSFSPPSPSQSPRSLAHKLPTLNNSSSKPQ